jgi:DNA-binding SARP family transcriptional activator
LTPQTLRGRHRKNVVIALQPCLASPVEFGVLGPLEARDGGRELPLGGPKQRALLAFFLLHANEALSRDRLVDALWGEQQPSTAAHTLDAYVSRLRKLVGRDRLTRHPPGYLFRIGPGEMDLDRFEQLAAAGREQLARGDAGAAARSLSSALALWRGPALADLLYERFMSLEAERLETLRLSVLEDRLDADLACGRSSELVAELEHLVGTHPLRERLLGQLMVALYRSGQQARALEAFRAGKRRFAEELGLEPGPALQTLETRDPPAGSRSRGAHAAVRASARSTDPASDHRRRRHRSRRDCRRGGLSGRSHTWDGRFRCCSAPESGRRTPPRIGGDRGSNCARRGASRHGRRTGFTLARRPERGRGRARRS